LQSITAIVIVGIGALLLGATAKMMGDTVHIIETAGYALIVLLGARLIWVKGRGFLRALAAARAGGPADAAIQVHHEDMDHDHEHLDQTAHAECAAHSHAAHGHARHLHRGHHIDRVHDHGHSPHDDEGVLPWGHAHSPEPEELAGPGGWRRGLSAVVAVGLRPCSGAIIVLVFALAQGLFLAGVASTFVMGLGTAITVAVIATLTIGARSFATRFAVARSKYGALFWRGVETAAAVLILLFGILLLTGTVASERMGLF
jgi:nickel/cobalt exporter